MKITQMLVIGLAAGACSKSAPAQETFPARHLGESTASPGGNASKPQPLTPDDPRVMNVSASITPQQAGQAAPPAPPPDRAGATSSTPVQQPTDIAPPSTTTEVNRPGVFSPPPASPSTNPPTPPPVAPPSNPTPAPQ